MPSFEVAYRFLSTDEGGRNGPPHQHTRWDFKYKGDNPNADGVWMIWPEFIAADGQVLPEGVIPSSGRAFMFIVNLDHERYHRLLSQYECTYTFDGITLPFPGSRGVLANREGSHLLSIPLDGPVIHCHFFIDQQLELDISPREVAGPLDHERILVFVENLAEALERPADITPEAWEENPFLTYSPATKSWVCVRESAVG